MQNYITFVCEQTIFGSEEIANGANPAAALLSPGECKETFKCNGL